MAATVKTPGNHREVSESGRQGKYELETLLFLGFLFYTGRRDMGIFMRLRSQHVLYRKHLYVSETYK